MAEHLPPEPAPPLRTTAADPALAGPLGAWRRLRRSGLTPGLAAQRAVRWVLGMLLSTVRYVQRLRRVDRRTLAAPTGPAPDADRAMPGDPAVLQRRSDGFGPEVQRRYLVRIDDSGLTPEGLIDALAEDINRLSPTEVAWWEPTGQASGMRVGDEYTIHMPGPWEGPVRVVDRQPTSVRLATLNGHMEAGEILFRAERDGDGLRFEIESWARAGDPLFDVVYRRLGLGREMQGHMWVHVCERVAELCGGHIVGKVQLTTATVDEEEDSSR